MKKNILLLFVVALIFSCTKETYVDTGVIDVKPHDCSIWEYLHTDSYNYDTLIMAIEKADLVHVFDGSDENYKNITFFAPTNISILRYMYGRNFFTHNYRYLRDVPDEECRALLMKHVIVGKYMKEDMPERDYSTEAITVYRTFTAIDGESEINAYYQHQDWNLIPRAGAQTLWLYSKQYGKVAIASANIECNNGVVHSMAYGYVFGEL